MRMEEGSVWEKGGSQVSTGYWCPVFAMFSLLASCPKSHNSLRDQLLTAQIKESLIHYILLKCLVATVPHLHDQIASGMLWGHPFARQWSCTSCVGESQLLPGFHPEGTQPIHGSGAQAGHWALQNLPRGFSHASRLGTIHCRKKWDWVFVLFFTE